jgi:SAM-dependent methyltransferase
LANVRPMLRRLRARAREYRDLPGRLDHLERLILDLDEGRLKDRSQERWVEAEPNKVLTFDRELTGDAFIRAAERHGAFGPGTTVVEIGPGYGRLAEAAERLGVGFERWVGVDLSEKNVAELSRRFDGRFEWIVGDAETADVAGDTLVSSLTFKHFYPTFEAALSNLAPHVERVVIDLLEGEGRWFEQWDGRTYIRQYTRPEVEQIFGRCGLRVEAFDTVEHDPDHRRLLAVGVR